MTRNELFENIRKRQSFLCVGLDTDLRKIPECLRDDANAMFTFNRNIIDATAPYCVAYKPNLAFYESSGLQGWQALEFTVSYIREHYPDHFLIADAKRGDIGNTSKMYARTFFEEMCFDTVTVAPYMGADSVTPFLEYEGKFVTLLALTSNKGAFDFQFMEDKVTGMRLFEKVLETSQAWGATPDNMMYVVGATKAEMLADIRRIVPDNFLLVPGVGAQGGSLDEVCRYGMNDHCGLLVNSSRGIIYADSSEHYAESAAQAAEELQKQMAEHLRAFRLI